MTGSRGVVVVTVTALLFIMEGSRFEYQHGLVAQLVAAEKAANNTTARCFKMLFIISFYFSSFFPVDRWPPSPFPSPRASRTGRNTKWRMAMATKISRKIANTRQSASTPDSDSDSQFTIELVIADVISDIDIKAAACWRTSSVCSISGPYVNYTPGLPYSFRDGHFFKLGN